MAVNPLPGLGTRFGRFLGNTISEAAGFGIGTAVAAVLSPRLQRLKNDQHAEFAFVPPPAGTMAQGVAQGQVDTAKARAYAAASGIGNEQFDTMVDVANTGPPLGYAFEAWRRTTLSDTQFQTALKRTGLEDEWNQAMVSLHDVLLTSTELANMQQQGFVSEDEANAEASLQGVTDRRQQLRFQIAGLPPGIAQGLEMWRRAIIDEDTFAQIVREGHTKIKYTDQLKQLKTRVLSELQFVEARVRGWIDNSQMYAGGALTGYSQPDMDMLHKTHGRPLSWHQVWIGIQRGGRRLDPTADMTAASTGIDPDFFAALQQSDIQQQWYDLAWKQRYTYPAAFVLRTLAKAGEIDAATLEETLKFIGWEPTFIAKVVTAWTGGTGTTATQKKQTLAHLTAEYLSGAMTEAALTTALTGLGYSAQQAADEINLAEFNAAKADRTRAIKALAKRYVGAQLSDADARTALARLGLPTGAIDKYLAAWVEERTDTLTTLSVAQIEKALKAGVLNAATATPLLEGLGESDAAIQTIIASNPPKA